MKYHEYPKALYREGEYSDVADHEAEAAARADGWTDWHSDQAAMAKQGEPGGKPARQVKAK